MSDSVAQDMIASFFDRWQRLEEEKAAISGDLKELFAEAKANGFDTKVLRVVFRDKVADQSAKSEFEAVYDLYWSALGTPRATGARPAQGIPEHDADGVIIEPDVAMRPQTVASRDAGPVNADAGQATVESPATHSEPVTDPTAASLPAEVTVAARSATDPNAAPVVADQSKPNPICRDPDDCGVYASWAMPCEACKRAAAHRSAA